MAITKDQLISDLAEACDLQKSDVRALLDQLGEIVADALENDGEISLPGIGKLIGLLQAPATKVAGVLQAPAGQLARVFNAYATKDAA